MATTLKTKNSVTTTVTPTTLAQGELAVNITDKKMWVGNASSTPVQIVGAGATNRAGGSNTQVQYNSSGDLAGSANMTFSGTALTLANDASISGLTVGKGGGALTSNTVFGLNAQVATAGAGEMTAIGNNALSNNVSTASNTAVGSNTLFTNTTGQQNVGLGKNALYYNTSGSANTALGMQSLQSNTTASNNTAVGYQAGYSNTTGGGNASFGVQALYTNTTGGTNCAFGYGALYFNTTASYSTAVGYQALYNSNRTADVNAFNTAVGYSAGSSVTTGQLNTFIGGGSGNTITTGSKNTIIGAYSGNQGGLDIRTASNYIVLSDGDGNPKFYTGSGGSDPTWTVNANSGASYCTLSWNVAGVYKSQIYYDVSASRLYVQNQGGGVYLTTAGTSWTSASDERLKENLVPITDGLNKVASLRAVTGNYISDEDKKSKSFLIAQDVIKVLPEAVDASNPDELGVQYTDVIPLLVAAIKELKAEVDSLKQQINGA